MKKLVKKQLKEDEFVSVFTKAADFAKKRTKEIIAAAALILFAILLFSALKFVRAQNLKKESRLLSRILEIRETLDEKPENVVQLEKMAKEGKFSRVSFLALATYWVERGEWEKAKEHLGKIKSGTKDLFYYQAQDLLAQVHMHEGEYDKAVSIYRKMEEEKPKEYTLDVVLFRLAEALEKKGDRGEALAYYKRVQEEFSQSIFSWEASQKTKRLETGK